MSKVMQNEVAVRAIVAFQLGGRRLWTDENGENWSIGDMQIEELHPEGAAISWINARTPVFSMKDATMNTHDDIAAYSGVEEGYILELRRKGELIEDPSLVLIYNPETCKAEIYRVDEAAPENWVPIVFFFMS